MPASVSQPTRNRPMAVMYVWSSSDSVALPMPMTLLGSMSLIEGLRVKGRLTHQSVLDNASGIWRRLAPPPQSRILLGKLSTFGNSSSAN